jgi:beta-glucosidase
VDNFEWDAGWDLRFGLYELDVVTQARKARRSGHFLAEIARRNGLDRQTIVQYGALGLSP